MTKTEKAKITDIQFGNYTIEGLMLPDGTFAIALTQVSDLLELRKSDASRNIKALLGKDLELRKQSTEITNNKIAVLTLEEFTDVIKSAALKGKASALNLVVMLAGLSLEQLWSDAFGIKFEREERQAWIKQRQNGKVSRRYLTDSIGSYIERHEVSENYIKFVYSNCSNHLNRIILGAKAKQAKEFYQVPKHSLLRNHIPVEALRELEWTEALASRLIDERDVEPLEAVKKASAQMFTKFIGMS